MGLIEKLAALFDPRGGRRTERRVISTLLHPAEPLQQVFTVNKIPSGIIALGQRAEMKSK